MSTEILDHPNITRLVQEHGTPLQVIDLEVVRRNVREFNGLFADFTTYYSTKTNPDPAIIDIMLAHDLSFDAATIGEIEYLITRGTAPERILYTHPVKSIHEIQRAVELGITSLTLDSLSELKKLELHAPAGNYFLRVRPIGNQGLYDYEDKHGADDTEATAILDYAVDAHLALVGLSFHVGSQTMGTQPWADALDRCYELLSTYYDSLPGLRKINVGSGFPAQYGFASTDVASLQTIADTIHEHRKQFPNDVTFAAEPGRVLVATGSQLIVGVVDAIARTDSNWIYTDMSAYDGLIEIIESAGKLPYVISGKDSSQQTSYIVAGKTLDPDDILGRDIALAADTAADDKLVIHDIGAYSTSFRTKYHMIPSPYLNYTDSQYDSDVMVGASAVASYGVIAQRDFKPGEKVFTVTGYKSPTRTRTSFQIAVNGHLEPCMLGAYLNHSCDPNAGMQTNEQGLLDVVAMKPITTGEEVIVDYAMFEYELADMATVECACGTALCRKHINGYQGLSPELRAKYQGYTAAHLVDQL